MLHLFRNPSFLPSCILAGVGILFLVLVFTLPPVHVFGLIGGTAVAIGLVLARLRRDAAENGPAPRIRTQG